MDYSLGFTRLNLDSDNPGSRCRVSVREGANEYVGACTEDDPSDDDPCHITVEEEAGIVRGEILCRAIPNRNTESLTRDLVKPRTGDEPFEFEIHGCTGL